MVKGKSQVIVCCSYTVSCLPNHGRENLILSVKTTEKIKIQNHLYLNKVRVRLVDF